MKPLGLKLKILIILVNLVSFHSQAQKLEIGANMGLMQYKGDIQPRYNLFSGRPGAGGFVRYNIIPALSIKGQGLFGFVAGRDKRVQAPQHRSRGYEFSSQILEYGGQIEYNFLDFRSSRNLRKAEGSPYLFLGFGSYSLSNRQNNLLDITNPPGAPNPVFTYTTQNTSSYSANALVYGVGYKKVWKSNWNIGGEFGARKLTTDTFDNFGYVTNNAGLTIANRSIPNTTNLALAKFNVPNTHLQDMYFYLNFSVSYVFYKVHCPNPR